LSDFIVRQKQLQFSSGDAVVPLFCFLLLLQVLALADLNRDGRPDLIATFSPPSSYRGTKLVVLINEGSFTAIAAGQTYSLKVVTQ